jgi:hypothetical protein
MPIHLSVVYFLNGHALTFFDCRGVKVSIIHHIIRCVCSWVSACRHACSPTLHAPPSSKLWRTLSLAHAKRRPVHSILPWWRPCFLLRLFVVCRVYRSKSLRLTHSASAPSPGFSSSFQPWKDHDGGGHYEWNHWPADSPSACIISPLSVGTSGSRNADRTAMRVFAPTYSLHFKL